VNAGGDGRLLAAALTVAALGWLALIVGAPTAAGGRMPFVAAVVYQMGSRICHQRPERSFHVAGTQMPVCARCFGLYAGGAAGLALAWAFRRRWSPRVVKSSLLVVALPIAVTVGLEWLRMIATSNTFRWFTGVPLGLVAGFTIIGLLRGPD
jgi:uncharacterized membrane protein